MAAVAGSAASGRVGRKVSIAGKQDDFSAERRREGSGTTEGWLLVGDGRAG